MHILTSIVTAVVRCIICWFKVLGVKLDVLPGMRIRNPVVCDTGQSSLYKNKSPFVVEQAFPLTEFVGSVTAHTTFVGRGGIMSTARPELHYPCISRA